MLSRGGDVSFVGAAVEWILGDSERVESELSLGGKHVWCHSDRYDKI